MAQKFGRQFQVVFEHSPIGITIMDGSGRIQYANSSVRNFLGYSEEELSGGFLTSFSHHEDSEFFQSLFSEVVEHERDSFQVVSRCRTRTMEDAWWRVDIRYVVSEEHSPFILAVIDDVTSQKNDEDRLRRAKELAESATRTKSAFLANMSHEIRTPLHTINAVADLLRETNLDEEQEEYLHQIQFAGEVLLGLINDILDFSKIEAGRLQLEKIPYDPVKTVEDAVDMVSMQAHRKGLEVVLSVDRELPRTTDGDPNRMRQVLVNLVNNAVKFTDSGFVKVDAGLRIVKSKPHLLVQVKDTGIGIESDRQDRLFKPFSQVDASMTRKFGGTGLGLSISRDLIRMMNGRIGVKSKPGKGSNFWFSLPLEKVSLERDQPQLPRGMPKAPHVLIIDDNRESALILKKYLLEWKADVTISKSGNEGIRELRQNVGGARTGRRGGRFSRQDVAFVLIDLQLPDMDGWQLASELKNDDNLKDIPLILMTPTGLSTGEAKMKLLHWFDGYLSKPVKRNDLLDTVQALFAGDLEELEAVTEMEEISDGGVDQEALNYPELVLIAEDHFVNQQLFQTILQKRGFKTLVASDGAEAVQCMEEHPEIGLVFMDVQMPKLNGYDATVRIRELGFRVPIVAVTANALSGDRDRCVRVGMDEYMSKPFRNADIGVVLERLRVSGAFLRRRLGDSGKEKNLMLEHTVPMDVDATIDAFMGDTDTAARVSLEFADRLEDQVKQVETYLHDGKIADARIVAHAIKGGAWNLNCTDLGSVAKTVEDACAGGNSDAAIAGLKGLYREARRFSDFVREVDFTRK